MNLVLNGFCSSSECDGRLGTNMSEYLVPLPSRCLRPLSICTGYSFLVNITLVLLSPSACLTSHNLGETVIAIAPIPLSVPTWVHFASLTFDKMESASSSPAIPKLGFDLFGIIFHELAQLVYKRSPEHLESLLLVNREWRSCALAHSSIWSMFYITWQIDKPSGSVQRWRNRACRFLERSKSFPLTIHIQFSGLYEAHARDPTCGCTDRRNRLGRLKPRMERWCDNNGRYWKWASDLIALLAGPEGKHMRRWGDLEIHWDDLYRTEHLSPSSLFQGMCSPMPALKRLSLRKVELAFGEVLSAIPALQTLIMNRCRGDPIGGLPTRLKYLELTVSSLPNLSTLSTLEHLNICGRPYAQEDNPLQKWVACKLPGLRVLELRVISPSYLRTLTVPNLHSLILRAPECFQSSHFLELELEDREEIEIPKPADLQPILPIIETLSVYWEDPWYFSDGHSRMATFIGGKLLEVLKMAIGLVEIRLEAKLYDGTRAMIRDKPHLVPELQRIMVFREGVPVEVDGRNIAGRLGVVEWRATPQLLPKG